MGVSFGRAIRYIPDFKKTTAKKPCSSKSGDAAPIPNAIPVNLKFSESQKISKKISWVLKILFYICRVTSIIVELKTSKCFDSSYYSFAELYF